MTVGMVWWVGGKQGAWWVLRFTTSPGEVLAVFEPAQELGKVGLFTVHQDSDAIYAAGDPENADNGEAHQNEGEANLPGWHGGERDAEVHEQRTAEWDQ